MQHLRLKEKNMIDFKKSLPKCSLQGSRTNWCWMMETEKSTKCSQRELSQNIQAAVSVPAAISLEWLCATMYGIIWPYLTLQPSVHWQCGIFQVLSVYKVYVQLEYYHMLGILNCQLRGRGGGEVVLSEKYWTLILSFASFCLGDGRSIFNHFFSGHAYPILHRVSSYIISNVGNSQLWTGEEERER